MKNGFDQLRKDLARALGFSSVADVPYHVCHEPGLTIVRLPGPMEFALDLEPSSVTHDIVGQGGSEEEAFEDALSIYRAAAAEMRKEGGNPLEVQSKYVIQ